MTVQSFCEVRRVSARIGGSPKELAFTKAARGFRCPAKSYVVAGGTGVIGAVSASLGRPFIVLGSRYRFILIASQDGAYGDR